MLSYPKIPRFKQISYDTINALTIMYNTKIDPNTIQQKIFYCFKFEQFTKDIEEKGDNVNIDKFGKVTFISNHSCDDSDTETKYPYYDFEFCPYCGKEL